MVVQAGILAVAGILVRIIGLLYNTPLVHIIKDEGFGYYDSAYAAYSIVLLISSYSIPSAVSKVMAAKLAKKEYRNAHRVFICSLIYVVIVGLIASLFVFFGAGILVRMENAVLPLKILAPTVFFSGILGVLRGFFQAQHTMVPTSISQILEQILNAVFSVWMAYILVNAAAGTDSSHIASMGAAGSTIGTGVGVLTALLFMFLVYMLNRKNVMQKIAEDTTPVTDSYKDIFKMILSVVTPFIISTGVYNLNNFLDKTIYQNIMMGVRNMAEADVAFNLSAMAKATKIANIPIALASAMATTMIPRLSSHIARNELKESRAVVASATKVTMFISIPASVGIAVLAKPIMRVIFNQQESLALSSAMLMLIAVTVALYGLSTLTQAVLQSINHMNVPIINATLAIVIHAAVMIVLMLVLPDSASLYAYGIATIVYALCLCIFNGIAVSKYLGYKEEIDKTFLRPFISSVAMGIMTWLSYFLLYKLTGINILALFVAVIVGVIVYFVLCLKWKAIGESELKSIPKGALIVKIAKKLRLL